MGGEENTRGGIGGLLWLGSSLWSIIDAPVTANRINRENQQSAYGHLFEFGNNKATIGIDPTLTPGRMGGRLTLHF